MTLLAFRDWVSFVRSQEGDREHRVDLAERRGEFESVGTLRDDLVDRIGAEPLVIELFHGSSCFNIFGAEQYFVSDIVFRSLSSVGIIESSHVIGSLDKCRSCLVSCLCHSQCEIVQGFELGFLNWFESQLGVLASIEHEWGGLC